MNINDELKDLPNYKIYYFADNKYDKTVVEKFFANDDDEAYKHLLEFSSKWTDSNKQLYYGTIHYVCSMNENGNKSPYYDIEEHREIGKWIHEDDPLIKRTWENIKDFFHYYFVDKPKDLYYWLRDIRYLLKNKEAYSNQWNLDWHILDSMKRNIPSLIKNSYALAFIDEAIIKIHSKDPGFDLKKYYEEHCSGYPKDVEDLAIKIQKEEYEKILLYVKLYQYYSNFGDIDFDDHEEIEFDKEWRHTLPIKKGTYDEISDYDEMNKLVKKYWDKIWDWMKAYGQKLND